MIEVLVFEGETPVNIHKRLKNVYMDNTLDYSNVRRWVQRINDTKDSDEEAETVTLTDQPKKFKTANSVGKIMATVFCDI